jgi:hypothetical protein
VIADDYGETGFGSDGTDADPVGRTEFAGGAIGTSPE